MMIRRIAVAAGLALVLLAGCSSEPAAPPPPEETLREAEEPEEVEPAPEPAPPPRAEAPPAPAPVAESNFEEPPEEPIDPSDQTLEDADATGLTTRATRSDDEQPATNDGQGENGL